MLVVVPTDSVVVVFGLVVSVVWSDFLVVSDVPAVVDDGWVTVEWLVVDCEDSEVSIPRVVVSQLASSMQLE